MPRFLSISLGQTGLIWPILGPGILVLRRRIWLVEVSRKWFVARVFKKEMLGFRVPEGFLDEILTNPFWDPDLAVKKDLLGFCPENSPGDEILTILF